MKPLRKYSSSPEKNNPKKSLFSNLFQILARHFVTFKFVCKRLLPAIIYLRKRPVLFSKYSGIGDIICTFPTVLKLKEKHPEAFFIYNCHPQYACLPRMAGITERVTGLRHTGLLRHYYGWLFSAFYEFPCADELPNDSCRDYVVKEYARDHGVDVPDAHPVLQIDSALKLKVRQQLKSACRSSGPIVLLQTGPTWAIREWPTTSWEALVKELNRAGFLNILQIGTSSHLSLGTVHSPALTGIISLIDQFSLEETAAVIALSNLFIGIDSGLLHMASALRIPCVGIFGPTSPQLRLPTKDTKHCVTSPVECQGCHHRIPRIHWESGCPNNAMCMKTIQASSVIASCLELLSDSHFY